MSRSRFGHIRWASLFVLALAIGLACGGRVSDAQGSSATAPKAVSASAATLQQAQALYDQSDFTGAQTLLRDKLASGVINGAEVRPARELLARSLVRSGNRVEAKEAFKGLIRRFPSYRPNASNVSPDEREVFDLALREVNSEQIEAGQRVPASLGFSFGVGSGANKDMAEIAVAGGGTPEYDVKPQFGGSVRFPLSQRLSLELELQRFRATNADSFPVDNRANYEVSALPFSLSLYYAALTRSHYRLNLFGGAGPLLTTVSKIEFGDFSGTAITLSNQKTGMYGHAGLEAEYLVTNRISLSGRVMGRIAKAEKLLEDFDFDAYGSATLKDREVEFNGFGATVGLRAYIGY